MKILVMSSQASNTGSTLRAEYIYKYLKKEEKQTDYIKPPFKSMAFMADFALSLVYYFFKLMNTRYDVVVIVKAYPNTLLPAFMLKSSGAKIVIDVDDLDYGYRKGFLSGVIKWMQSKLIKHADIITTHNDTLQKMIVKENPEFKERIYKLLQGVDTEIFNSAAINKKNMIAIRKTYGNKKILFYMAHLNIASYLEDIFKSLSYLKEDVILLIAGGGPLLNYYKRIAKKMGLYDKVVFLGQLAQKETIDYIAAAEVCLVYYADIEVNKYRASMKLREYLALGKKVAATAVGEIKSFKKLVFLSRPDPKHFSGVISKAIKNLDKKEKKGYKFINEKYSWSREIKGFYKYLLNHILQMKLGL